VYNNMTYLTATMYNSRLLVWRNKPFRNGCKWV